LAKQADSVVNYQMTGGNHTLAVKLDSVGMMVNLVNGVDNTYHFLQIFKACSVEFLHRLGRHVR
jgi:hypothetical protein